MESVVDFLRFCFSGDMRRGLRGGKVNFCSSKSGCATARPHGSLPHLAAPRRCQLRRGLGGGALEVSLPLSMLRMRTASFGITVKTQTACFHVLPLYRKAPSPLPSNT